MKAVEMIQTVCLYAAQPDYLTQLRRTFVRSGIARAVADHDTAALLDWLLEAVSYQGVSDALASRYMDEHGRLPASTVAAALAAVPSCTRLESFSAFVGCDYRKTARTCAEPDHFGACPLPRHPLRNGRLNQVAYGLALFARDVCGGDLVGWIDDRLAAADDVDAEDRGLALRAAVLEPLACIHGVSFKVLSMSLADLLLGADPDRHRWVTAGSGMVAVDSLVHNWLARTGTLQAFGAEHAYGPGCYRPGGCAGILDAVARHLDARAFCPDGPAVFPRLVQHAVWRFCAAGGLDICNGNRINERFPCGQRGCPLFDGCGRQALQPVRYKPWTGPIDAKNTIV